MTNEAFKDMNRNQLVPVSDDNATRVTTVIPDSTPPSLVFFDLNMTSEILSLTFNESVDASTLVVQELVVQQAEYVSMVSLVSSYQLVSGAGSSTDDYIVDVQQNTYLRFGSGLIRDMNGNSVVEVVNGAGVTVMRSKHLWHASLTRRIDQELEPQHSTRLRSRSNESSLGGTKSS